MVSEAFGATVLVWTFAPELSAVVVGPRECHGLDRVHGYVKRRCKASLKNSTSVFLLPGAVNFVVCGFYTAEHYTSARQ